MEKEIKEIPFGAKDSELYKFEYAIPEGYEAEIKDGKVIVQKKESEDERIRKVLLRCCDDWEKGQFGCMAKEDVPAIRAYLERQKESQPLVRDGEIEDKKRDIVAAIRKYYPKDYAEYLTSFLKGLSPEDNSEDEYGQEMLGIAYKLMYVHIPENLRTKEFWDSLKFMREYTGKVAIIHSYEQPAEWSEEDEHCLHQLILFCENCMQQDSEAIRCATWIKSLRPQPHWKPSEEQMNALRIAYEIGTANESWAMSVLKTLYADLKKL